MSGGQAVDSSRVFGYVCQAVQLPRAPGIRQENESVAQSRSITQETMKAIVVFGEPIQLRGKRRTLKGPAVERAIRNSRKLGFSLKFQHPRCLRPGKNQKP